MIEESEAILFILATAVFIWMLINRKCLAQIPCAIFLKTSYYVLYLGFACTVLEGLFLGEVLNHVEHICYALSMVLVAVWSYKMFGRKES
ncbi:hypothetical protein ACFL3D_03035 [Candidatus Omnitrophota bacterium]